MNVLSRARRAPAASLVAFNYGAQALTLISGVLLARGLTVQDRGTLALYLSIITLCAQLLNAPLAELAIVRFRAGSPLVNRDARSSAVAVAAWVGAAALLTIATTSTAASFAPFWFIPSYLSLNLISSIAGARVITGGRVLTFGLLKLINIVCVIAGMVIVTILVAERSDRLLASASVFIATEALTAFAAWMLAGHRVNGLLRFQRRTGIEAASPAWRLLAAALVTGVLGQSYDRLLLLAGASLASATQLAHVVVALSTLTPITVVGSALIPLKLANPSGHNESATPQAPIRVGVRLGTFITAVLVLYLILLAILVPVVFGEGYADAARYAWALSPGCVLLVVGRLRSASLRSGGQPGRAIKCEVLSSAAFGLAWVLVGLIKLPAIVSLAVIWLVVGATLAWLTTSAQEARQSRLELARD